MDKWQIMRARHSVRAYLDKPIEEEKVQALTDAVAEVNRAGNLHVQLFVEEPEAFAAGKTQYGAFRRCKNYFAMVAAKDKVEEVGYYGEILVLKAQELGLNTCWVALTYRKGKVTVDLSEGEMLHVVIALGYGQTQGMPHADKPLGKVADIPAGAPQWYLDGVAAARLAPTAINQQKYHFALTPDGKVMATAKMGPYSKMDLGIAKLHFEWGAGKENFEWA